MVVEFPGHGMNERHAIAAPLHSALFGAALFVLCLIGIWTRPGADIASFWPANAFMLGMLVRYPVLATRTSWLFCGLAYMLADLVTGADIGKTIILNLGNLLAVFVGYRVLMLSSEEHRSLQQPASIFYLLRAVMAASLTAGALGMVADPILFGGDPLRAAVFWTVTELVNYAAFLPMLLTIPAPARATDQASGRVNLVHLAPLAAFAASIVAGSIVGGPGALVFPIPALLWCAVTYSLFATAMLSFLFSAWTLLTISSGYLPVATGLDDRSVLLSIRFGVALVAFMPLVVACVVAANRALVERLTYLSSHDRMTGVMNRAGFIEEAEAAVKRRRAAEVSMMMLDIDHFKSINDTYGHAAGDEVLMAFADVLKRHLRRSDIVGRVGGEEFAVLLVDYPQAKAGLVADRINKAFADSPVQLPDGRVVNATVSIGFTRPMSNPIIDQLLATADEALYSAKNAGRNTNVLAGSPA